MKIAIVTRNFVYPLGGFEEHVCQLSRKLVQAGNDVTIYSTTLFSEHESPTSLDVPVVRRSYTLRLFGYCYSPALFEAIGADRPDLLHAQGWGNHAVDGSLGLSEKLGVPFVVTPHGFFHEMRSNAVPKFLYNRILSRRIFDRARFIAISSHHADYLKRKGAKTISLVPNGIDPHEFSHGWTESAHPILSESSFKVLMVGRLARYKRLDTALRAFPLLLKADPDAQLVIVGEDWGAEAGLRSLAEALGISKSVLFTGRMERAVLLGIYQSCDVFVSTSSYEGFGIALLEALASGLPVVTTPVGAAIDLDSYVTKFGIGDWRRLGEILFDFRTDRNKYLEITKQGRKDVLTSYSWESVAAKTKRVYDEALSARNNAKDLDPHFRKESLFGSRSLLNPIGCRGSLADTVAPQADDNANRIDLCIQR